ncbi:TPR-like protein [Corynespora cassiicola Philippines]|uniref:DNA-(apurinic or apyrimidinic site) lyase n=1 Tax=Corynespora cassiicola Philippines TaxID=1448308 RepID=A0A2T2P662_CORCC|nr:TPR-like protein [Corynespora cassiicola Philippines]
MPEIAEIARIVHYLKKHAVGKTIAAVKAQEDTIIFGKVGTSASAFQEALTGKKIIDARQQGKYFWLEMESAPHPLMHFGMSGWMKFSNDDTAYYRPAKEQEEEWPPRFWKFVLELKEEPKCEVAFIDARRLGRVRLVDAKAEDMRKTSPLKENGPDPVIDSDILTVEWLSKKLQSKRVPVKALLLDQANISGIGNWVGDEIMYQARLHPEQYSNSFSDAQVKRLHDAMMYVCKTAVDLLADSDKFPEDWLMKYRWGKGKKETPRLPNGAKITFLKVGGRTSAIVPSLQKKTGAVAADVEDDAEESGNESTEEIKPKKEAKGKLKAVKKESEAVAKPAANTKRGRKKEEEDIKDEEIEEAEKTEEPPVAKKQKRVANGTTTKSKKGETKQVKAEEPLPSKENSLFRSLVKYYESKQYKKGLKAADQILRKVPNHADTQAMKALILNSTGQGEEAFTLAKLALKNDMKSHICWHVYGLLWRSVKNYEEAIKAYKFALRIEPDSQNILRDLALLQCQIRDFEGYIDSRRKILTARSQLRQNWTALAVAYHLAGNLLTAEKTLTTYEETLKQPPPRTDLEHSEAVLYKNTIIYESGDVQRALDHLEEISKTNLDRTAVLELRAKYLLELGKMEEAEKAYRTLLSRNSEYRAYYDGLEKSLGLDRSDDASIEKLAAIYESYAAKNERNDAARRIPLDFLKGKSTGDAFKTAADQYLRRMLNKGVPSTFPNIKALYNDAEKKSIIEDLVLGYTSEKKMNGSAEGETNGDVSDRFEQSVLYFLAQHYNYILSRDLQKAVEYIDRLIELSPKSVDYHQTKARVYKHLGDTQKAAETINYARELDLKDRYINTKCAKYQLRNNENDKALDTMSKFTRNEATGGTLGDLHDMQCMWYLLEDGEAYMRQNKLGLALKRFTAVSDIFETWHEDQFDFHSFSLRKGQIRAYIDMIRWEDHLRDHPFFTRAAISAIKIYLKLADKPELSDPNYIPDLDKMDASERKKAQKKLKKEQEKAEKAEADKRAAAAAKATATPDEEKKKVDEDPRGEKLLQTKEPLQVALKFLQPLLEFSPKNIEGQNLGFEVYFRKEKHALAAKCLHNARSIDSSNPKLHEQATRFRQASQSYPTLLSASKDTISAPVLETLNTEFTTPPADADLKAFNDTFMKEHPESPAHLQAAYNVRYILDNSTKAQNEADLKKLLEFPSTTIDVAAAGLSYLAEWNSDEKTVEEYRDAAAKRWPTATIFQKN